MKFSCCFSLFLCLMREISYVSCKEEIPRVGIVGAGIGGTSAAYFLRQLFGENVKIDVFEKQHVGGRLAPITINGQNYNAGGTVIHLANKYMWNFTDLLGLQRDLNPEESKRLAIFDGNDIVLQTSDYAVVTIAKLLWRYGMDAYNIQNWVKEKIIKPFVRFYELQHNGHAFSNVEDLIGAMDPSLVGYSKKSIKNLLKEEGFSDRFIDELAMGAMRNNYGQTTGVHGLVGVASLAGVEPGLWNVAGGNHQVPQGLLRKSNANLIRGTVTKISVSQESPPIYEVDYAPENSQAGEDLKSREYDIIILAIPYYNGMSDIKFEDFQNSINPVNYNFHHTIASFLEGQPNMSYFNIDSISEFPSIFFTTNDSIFFNSFAKQMPVSGSATDKPVYKVFSNKVPNVGQLKQLIPEWSDLRIVDWMAYPEYESSVELPSFTLHEQLYHVNAIEMAASAMEMSCVAAKNVALLAYYRYMGQYDKIDEVITKPGDAGKTEL